MKHAIVVLEPVTQIDLSALWDVGSGGQEVSLSALLVLLVSPFRIDAIDEVEHITVGHKHTLLRSIYFQPV